MSGTFWEILPSKAGPPGTYLAEVVRALPGFDASQPIEVGELRLMLEDVPRELLVELGGEEHGPAVHEYFLRHLDRMIAEYNPWVMVYFGDSPADLRAV